VAELGEVIEECAIRVLAEAARRVGGVVAYRSDGETRGNVFRSPFWVSTGEGFPERRRKSSWSMARGLWPGACGVLSCRKSRLGGRARQGAEVRVEWKLLLSACNKRSRDVCLGNHRKSLRSQ
jgi:hypothetical protein